MVVPMAGTGIQTLQLECLASCCFQQHCMVILFLMLFVYKTYKTMFQRLIVYYIMLSLRFAFSGVVRIMKTFIDTDGKWKCIFEWYLFTSLQYAWYTYITAISNFTLLFVPYLQGRRKQFVFGQAKYKEKVFCAPRNFAF